MNGDGNPHHAHSSDVNDFIRQATDGEFTAKHFRTWGASVIAFEKLMDLEDAKRISVNTMIEPVAEALGNTVAMSRKAYVHPALIDAVKERPRDPLGGMERPRAPQAPLVRRGRLARVPRARLQTPAQAAADNGLIAASSAAMRPR